MASSLKAKVASALGTSNDSTPSSAEQSPSRSSLASNDGDALANQKYVLRVTAGPSYDPSTHDLVYVNDSSRPTIISNDFITAAIRVRIRDYAGLPRGSPRHCAYFDHPTRRSDQYSISFSFVPKCDLPSRDLVWGNDFDHPVRDRLPPGFNAAFRIVKEAIDPGLSCDAYADKPWLYGPALSCWFTFRMGDKVQGGEDDLKKMLATRPEMDGEDVLLEGADGSGKEERSKKGLPEDAQKRRKYFLDETRRGEFTFEQGRLYQGDFFNSYLDFNKFALKLPGFSLSVVKYIDNKTHHLRYTFKNRETGDVYFCVVLTLLFGDEVKAALAETDTVAEEKVQSAPGAAET